MSSASKGLRRVGIGGLSALIAAATMTGLASTAQASWAAAGGQIGLVDTSNPAAGTQGATLVYPGDAAADLGSLRLAIPNTFKAGDTIDLAIMDRTATATANGAINADTAHKLGFTKAPTVTVDPTPYAATVTVGPVNAANGALTTNTEGAPAPWTAANKPTTAPKFTASLVASTRGAGVGVKDIIRLTQVDNQAGGDATGVWSVSVADLQAALGTSVSPGELRIVPFAYNGTPASDSSNWSPLFAGNRADVDGNGNTFDPVIGTYTVPAYVSPVTWSVAAPSSIIADGSTQQVGDVTVAETNSYSLGAGTYTITVGGASVANTAANPVTAKITGGATNETVSAATTATTVTFTIDQPLAADKLAADKSKATITLSGLRLASGTPGQVTYTLTGAGLDPFLDTPAGGAPASQSPAPDGVGTDASFSANINQADIEAPALSITGVASDVQHRIGGADRYQTAAKIAVYNGSSEWAVIASGENFPDALSANYLASALDTSVLLTKNKALPTATIDAMRLMGVKRVIIVGGTGVVSSAVEAQLKGLKQWEAGGVVTVGQGNLQVTRIAGADRYKTNKAANEYGAALIGGANPVGRTIPAFPGSSKLTALVASGEGFADALAAGPATNGVTGPLPLILTKGASLTAAAKAQLATLGIEHTVIVGGEGAVSAATQAALTSAGVSTARLAGADRYATATAVADWEIAPYAASATNPVGGLGFNNDTVYLANGLTYADALAGGPLAGDNESPILLTQPATLSGPTATWLAANATDYDTVVALGLGGAVSNGVLNAANAAVAP